MRLKKYFFTLFLGCFFLTACATVPAPQKFTVQGDHGNLSAVLQAPSHAQQYPLVIIFHGFNANKEMGLLTEIAAQLNKRGMGTLLFDFNGHGESEGSFLDMTIPNEWEDARRIYHYAAQLPNVSSISAVGHSQGSLIAALLAGELGQDALKALVLLAPAPELLQETASGNLFGVTFDPQNIPDFITLPTGLKVGGAYLKTTPHVPLVQTAEKYTGPVLVIHSQDDELVPYHYGAEFSRLYPNGRLHTEHGQNHNFTQNTPAVAEVAADFLQEQVFR